MELTRDIAKKVLDTVDAGLCKGKGEPVPGQMCVEAAVNFAMGLPHSDNPPCVGSAVRAFKIRLNDSNWSSNEARAKGMREVALAQLGSIDIDQVAFAKIVAEQTIRRIVPIALREAAKVVSDEHKPKLEEAAVRCEQEGTEAAADAAYAAARAAAYAAEADAANAAAYAAEAAADAAAADAANAAADAAEAAAYAADAAYAAPETRDSILSLAAKIAVEALVKLGCKGVEWLDLCV